MAEKLQAGSRFPELELAQVDGTRVRVPEELPGPYRVLLFYRGHW